MVETAQHYKGTIGMVLFVPNTHGNPLAPQQMSSRPKWMDLPRIQIPTTSMGTISYRPALGVIPTKR